MYSLPKCSQKTYPIVGPKEGLGIGIIALGLLLFLMPAFSKQIADVGFISGDAFGILLGSVYVISVFIILAGIAIIVARFKDDGED